MPLDVTNVVASEMILRNSGTPVDTGTTARASIAAGLIPGVVGLLVPLVAARAKKPNGEAEGAVVPLVADGHTTLDEATQRLAANTFAVTSQRAYSADVKPGVVISQSPRPGATRPLKSSVALVISDGPPPTGNLPVPSGHPATEDDLSAAKQDIEGQLTAAKLEIETQLAGLGAKIDALAKGAPAPAATESVGRGKSYAS